MLNNLAARHADCCEPDVNTTISPAERQLLANLLIASGRDPDSFQATVQPDGLVRVIGPRGTAVYPRENWFTRFSRHLDHDFFDPQQRAPNGPRFSRKMPANEAGRETASHG